MNTEKITAMTRIHKYNASLSATPSWKWKVQRKRNGKWFDVCNANGVVVFNNEFHAENYRKKISGGVVVAQRQVVEQRQVSTEGRLFT